MKGTTTLNKTEKRKAVNRVFQLVKNGDSVTNSRKIIARELDIAPNTLWHWQNKFDMVTPDITKSVSLVKSNGTVAVRSNPTAISSLSNVKHELGRVFTSLIRKDGQYTNKDANTISQVTGSMLNISKHELQVHRYADKMHKREKTIQQLLT